jgi:hypothetical protein
MGRLVRRHHGQSTISNQSAINQQSISNQSTINQQSINNQKSTISNSL